MEEYGLYKWLNMIGVLCRDNAEISSCWRVQLKKSDGRSRELLSQTLPGYLTAPTFTKNKYELRTFVELAHQVEVAITNHHCSRSIDATNCQVSHNSGLLACCCHLEFNLTVQLSKTAPAIKLFLLRCASLVLTRLASSYTALCDS